MAWSPQGDLVATGSNDKTVKLMRYNEVQKQLEGKEIELAMHDGTLWRKKFSFDTAQNIFMLIKQERFVIFASWKIVLTKRAS